MDEASPSREELLNEIAALRRRVRELEAERAAVPPEPDQAEGVETFRDLFRSVDELIYIQDEDGRFLNVNPAVEEAYGYGRDELIGQTPEFLADPDRTDLEATWRHFRLALAGEPQRLTWWARRRNGDSFLKDLSLTRGTYFGRTVVIGVARDITLQRERELERERLIDELQRALQQVRVLSGIIPICTSCKSIRNDAGYWTRVEQFISEHSGAHFTHGLCPDCVERLYPDFIG